MGKQIYDAVTRARALEMLTAGEKVKDVAKQLGINVATAHSWRQDLISKGLVEKLRNTTAPASPKAQEEDNRSVEQQLIDWEFTVALQMLENKALMEMLDEPDRARRREIEITYLRKRLGLYGDKMVKPLGAKATNGAHVGERA